MKGERIIETGGVLLFVAFIIFLLPVLRIGTLDTTVIMPIAFFGLVILGFILVGVGWWVKKNEPERD
ncbi:MAG: hypothetical protein LN417_09785 [Candidatus Thermoplasmatota archaeon]|nr:hypothetical protein [Candidatus Thermoplasmatota archaeon]